VPRGLLRALWYWESQVVPWPGRRSNLSLAFFRRYRPRFEVIDGLRRRAFELKIAKPNHRIDEVFGVQLRATQLFNDSVSKHAPPKHIALWKCGAKSTFEDSDQFGKIDLFRDEFCHHPEFVSPIRLACKSRRQDEPINPGLRRGTT